MVVSDVVKDSVVVVDSVAVDDSVVVVDSVAVDVSVVVVESASQVLAEELDPLGTADLLEVSEVVHDSVLVALSVVSSSEVDVVAGSG